MYLIADWQNEEDITILKDSEGNTLRFDRMEDATERLVRESISCKNIYLSIVQL